MIQPSARRKGLRSIVHIILVVAVAVIVSLPISVILGAFLTPYLSRLEATVGIELAGHSGPAEWILWTLSALLTILFSVLALRGMRGSPTGDAEPGAER